MSSDQAGQEDSVLILHSFYKTKGWEGNQSSQPLCFSNCRLHHLVNFYRTRTISQAKHAEDYLELRQIFVISQ